LQRGYNCAALLKQARASEQAERTGEVPGVFRRLFQHQTLC